MGEIDFKYILLSCCFAVKLCHLEFNRNNAYEMIDKFLLSNCFMPSVPK